MDDQEISLLRPYGYSESSCGYCERDSPRASPSSSKKFGVISRRMSTQLYQDMIDRGWRRSGEFLYHPDMTRTCCPQYTIRLDVNAFKPTKKHRQCINRFNRFLSTGYKPCEGMDPQPSEASGSHGNERTKSKGKAPFDLSSEVRSFQSGYGQIGAHPYEVEIRPAVATKETFDLYARYQLTIHNDQPSDVTLGGFKRFLCGSPLMSEPIEYDKGVDTSRLPAHYGSYHMLYRVDGVLIAFSVIDVLPSCVSSVYFVWDPDWAWAGLGKFSALVEIALALEMARAGAPGMGWLYMGYWIANCVKMRYKSEYAPSYLLDPGTNKFHCLTQTLDTYLQAYPIGYTPFADIEALPREIVSALKPSAPLPVTGDAPMDTDNMERLRDWPYPSPPGALDPDDIDHKELDSLIVLVRFRGSVSRLVRYSLYREHLIPEYNDDIAELVAMVGPDLMANVNKLEEIKDKVVICLV